MIPKESIVDRVIEDVIASQGRGVSLRLVGTRWGMSFHEIERKFVECTTDYKNARPKCTRNMRWNPETRLREIEQLKTK